MKPKRFTSAGPRCALRVPALVLWQGAVAPLPPPINFGLAEILFLVGKFSPKNTEIGTGLFAFNFGSSIGVILALNRCF